MAKKSTKKSISMKKFLSVKDPVERKIMLKTYSPEAKRYMMFSSRRKARTSIDWLLFYVENLQNVTDNLEKELSKVFDQRTLLKWGKIGEAMKKGLYYKESALLTNDKISQLMADLNNEHIKFEPLRSL